MAPPNSRTAANNLRLFRLISANRHRVGVQRLAAIARKVLGAVEYSSGNATSNGELDLLDRLASSDECVILDCGANVGSWSLAANARFSHASIHAIEPIVATISDLRRAVAVFPSIVVHHCAFSDRSGEAAMSVNDADRATASLTERVFDAQRRFESVTLITGDQFLTDNNIGSVAILKIDAEGHDLAVLRGFSDSIRRRIIAVVQFEISGWNAVSRTWVADFYDILERAGYVVGKVTPAGVELGPYTSILEDFTRTQNFVGVVSDDAPLVRRVRGSAGSHL